MKISEIAERQSPLCLLNSNRSDQNDILAFGEKDALIIHSGENHPLEILQKWLDKDKSWVFGCISYDFTLGKSTNPDLMTLPNLLFFRPHSVYRKTSGKWVCVSGENHDKVEDDIPPSVTVESMAHGLSALTNQEQYLAAVKSIQKHIQKGNVYELNYCQGYIGKKKGLNSYHTYQKLRSFTQAPFSAYFKMLNVRLMCGSPERFLCKKGSTLLSQPIKGTRPRSADLAEDLRLKEELASSIKDRSENVMITDLVRNDLSKIAMCGSVSVKDLFGIHSFNTVHQMISSVCCEVGKEKNFSDLLSATFPMGSMTGAPKISAMNLIDEHENFKRGLFSGCVGYIQPNGDFDFNVVIRSLIYNTQTQTVGAFAGGAIVSDSIPEEEYRESLLKLEALFKSISS